MKVKLFELSLSGNNHKANKINQNSNESASI